MFLLYHVINLVEVSMLLMISNYLDLVIEKFVLFLLFCVKQYFISIELSMKIGKRAWAPLYLEPSIEFQIGVELKLASIRTRLNYIPTVTLILATAIINWDKQSLDLLNWLSQPEAKMSSTLLEVTRAAHEDVERLERLVVKDLQNDPPTSKDGLYQSHRVRNNIDTIISTTEKLVILPYPMRKWDMVKDFVLFCVNFLYLFLNGFRLKYMKIKTMLGKMKSLLLEVKQLLELMSLVLFMIDWRR